MTGAITTVVNIRRGDLYDVYIGRPPRGKPRNILGNGYQIGPDGDRAEVIRKWAYDFPLRWRTEPEFRAAILAAEGKRLGCFCAPKQCHGDVIQVFLAALPAGESAGFAAIQAYVDRLSRLAK